VQHQDEHRGIDVRQKPHGQRGARSGRHARAKTRADRGIHPDRSDAERKTEHDEDADLTTADRRQVHRLHRRLHVFRDHEGVQHELADVDQQARQESADDNFAQVDATHLETSLYFIVDGSGRPLAS
jgi:hypothetical protein